MIASSLTKLVARSFFFVMITMILAQGRVCLEGEGLSVAPEPEPGRIVVRSEQGLDLDLEAALGAIQLEVDNKADKYSYFRPLLGLCLGCCSIFSECFYQAYVYGSTLFSRCSCCYVSSDDQQAHSYHYKKRHMLALVVMTILISQCYASFTLANVGELVARGCGDVKEVCALAQASVNKIFSMIEKESSSVKDFFKNIEKIVEELPQIRELMQRVLDAYYLVSGQGREFFDQHFKKIFTDFSYFLEHATSEQLSRLVKNIVEKISLEVEGAVEEVVAQKLAGHVLPLSTPTPPPVPSRGSFFF